MTNSIQRRELELQAAVVWQSEPSVRAKFESEKKFVANWEVLADLNGFAVEGAGATEEELRRARSKPATPVVLADMSAEEILSVVDDLQNIHRKAQEAWTEDLFMRIVYKDANAVARQFIASALCCGGLDSGDDPPPIHHLEVQSAANGLWELEPSVQAAFPDRCAFVLGCVARARERAEITGFRVMPDGSERVSLRALG
jgi:hypothetical protein